MKPVPHAEVRRYFSRLGTAYDRWWVPPCRDYVRRRQEQSFRSFAREAERYLEVGCGTGLHLALVEAGRAYGVDLSFEMTRISASRCQAAMIVQASADRLPFRTDSFDRVGLPNVFQYLEDPEKALVELVRVTRPGGSILFTVFTRWSLALSPLRFAWYRARRRDVPPFRFYSVGEIRRMLAPYDYSLVGSGLRLPVGALLPFGLIEPWLTRIEDRGMLSPYLTVEMLVRVRV